MTSQAPAIRAGVTRGQRVIQEPEAPVSLPARERILMYGREGTGKTESWLSIAEMFPVPFYVIDTDDSVQRMLETDHPNLPNIHTIVAQGWAEFEKGVDDSILKIRQYVAGIKDPTKEQLPWLVVDFADATWDMVQNYYTEQVFNQGIDEYFLLARKGNKNSKQLQPLEGWTDWQVINKIFQSRWNVLTKGGGPFHLYITAKAVDLAGDIESKSLYKALKKMPGGEKRMGGRVHTVLMSSVDQDGWYLSTAKDRGRPILTNLKSVNFAVSYLIKTAGWKP
ncbi:MAG TPA: AAA family ATPase [Patescibacteria group bacterium]|nr:AAA family ATPase [Patescibacteria group bacterium]